MSTTGTRRGKAAATQGDDAGTGIYNRKNVILFGEETFLPQRPATIRIAPERDSVLVGRIVMHRTIATKLVLKRIFVGKTPKTNPGSGSCEIFLADVPNWTPHGMIISPNEPLVLLVQNPLDIPLKAFGSVIVWERETTNVDTGS